MPLFTELKNTNYGYETITKKKIKRTIESYIPKNDDYLKGLLSTVKRFNENLGKEFGLDNCAKITFRKSLPVKSKSIT